MDLEYSNGIKVLTHLSKVDQLLFGKEYIQELVRHIALELNVKYVMVGRAIEPERTKIQTDFMWAGNNFVENVVYDLSGTPCVNVICGTRVNSYLKDVAKKFPEDKMLSDMNVEAYIGAPFLHTDGGLIGLLVIMDDKEIKQHEALDAIIEVLAARIGTEYRRMAFEDSLRKINENLEKEVEQRTQDLKLAFEHLKRTQRQMISQEKLATIGRITFGIAHELKNPLNVIINSAEIIQDLSHEELTADNLKKLALMIQEHGERANDIIMSMLKQARQDSDTDSEWIDLVEIINHSLDMCIRSLGDSQFKAKLIVSKNLPESAKVKVTNPASVERVFINIFDNSIYALRKKIDSTSEKIFTPELSISAESADNFFNVIIRDNGTGIPARHLANLFREFYTTKPPGEGTGLGLSIAKETLSKNCGDITIESIDGQFTEVHITLPVNGAEQDKPLNSEPQL